VKTTSRQVALRGALEGAGVGFVFAALLIGVGVLRALIVKASGRHLAPLTAQDARLLAFYVGGFVVAGSLIGTAAPFFPGRFGTYARFVFGGMVLVLAIVIGDQQNLGALDGIEWIIVPVLGTVFGLAAAYGWLKH
jgi:hypothetical protein